MNQIIFSHRYRKLLGNDNEIIHKARLIQVLPVDLKDLSKEFLDYDTDYGKYKLNFSIQYLMLFFLKEDNNNLFTTLRTKSKRKEEYYKRKIGEEFEIVI